MTVIERYTYFKFDPSLVAYVDVRADLLNCSLTASGEKEAWLTEDLGEVNNIASIHFVSSGGFK